MWGYTGTYSCRNPWIYLCFGIDRNVTNSNTCKVHRFFPMSLSQNVRVLDRHASKHAQKCCKAAGIPSNISKAEQKRMPDEKVRLILQLSFFVTSHASHRHHGAIHGSSKKPENPKFDKIWYCYGQANIGRIVPGFGGRNAERLYYLRIPVSS